jgi:hypothetical protein
LHIFIAEIPILDPTMNNSNQKIGKREQLKAMEILVHSVIQLQLRHREEDVEEGGPLTPHFPESLA